MSTSPLPYRWTGEAFEPVSPYFAKECDKRFVVGEIYRLEVREERSSASHRQYFAALHEAWVNLPEDLAERLPTSEHLRKLALIRTGYRDERSIVCATKAEAQRLAAFIRPMDEFAIVAVQAAVVTVWTAKSQSMRAMGKQDFQASKDAVLDYVGTLIGTSTEALHQNAGRAA